MSQVCSCESCLARRRRRRRFIQLAEAPTASFSYGSKSFPSPSSRWNTSCACGACTNDHRDRYRHPVTGLLRYAGTPFALIDLFAILPFYLSVILPVHLRFMRAFQLLRVLKLTRYATAVETLGTVVYNERRALAGTLLIIMVLLSSLVYFA